jgi:hypothetical protein
MNWRNNPEIQAARNYGKQFDRRAVVVLSFDEGGRYSVVSYGANTEICKAAGKVADQIADRIANGTIDDLEAAL